MNRLAVFVEGQTEQVFLEQLVLAIAGKKHVRIEKRKVSGGATCRRRSRLIEAVGEDSGQQYYVLLVDCGGDGSVKSRIREEYDSLARVGYSAVIGVRDVYPLPRSDIPELWRNVTVHSMMYIIIQD